MTDRRLLFKSEMVIATLEDRKTNTRRLSGLELVNSYPGSFIGDGSPFGACGYKGLAPSSYFIKNKKDYEKNPALYHWFLGRQEREINPIPVKCPYGAVGDRLWVRETFSGPYSLEELPPREWHKTAPIWYWADGNPDWGDWTKPKPSIFMLRWASRITLEITAVRCERLQDITKADAIAEGIETDKLTDNGYWKNYEFTTAHPCRSEIITDEKHRIVGYKSPVASYASLWRSINGPGSWDANPWVWVIEFRRLPK